MHVGGWIARSLMYIEPFMADPEDHESNKVCRCLCVICGP